LRYLLADVPQVANGVLAGGVAASGFWGADWQKGCEWQKCYLLEAVAIVAGVGLTGDV